MKIEHKQKKKRKRKINSDICRLRLVIMILRLESMGMGNERARKCERNDNGGIWIMLLLLLRNLLLICGREAMADAEPAFSCTLTLTVAFSKAAGGCNIAKIPRRPTMLHTKCWHEITPNSFLIKGWGPIVAVQSNSGLLKFPLENVLLPGYSSHDAQGASIIGREHFGSVSSESAHRVRVIRVVGDCATDRADAEKPVLPPHQ